MESSAVLITRDRESVTPELGEKYTEKEILNSMDYEMLSVNYKSEMDSGLKEEIGIEIEPGKVKKRNLNFV